MKTRYERYDASGKKFIIEIEKDAPQWAHEKAQSELNYKIDYTCLKCKSRQVLDRSHAWCHMCISNNKK